MAIITLITDFGTKDSYVAQMKGVILGISPNATIVDVTHEVPPQDVLRAAMMLPEVTAAFPNGTIHLVVVDPGVGSARKILAAKMEWADRSEIVICPDNGIITLWRKHSLADFELRELTPEKDVSPTFHGRDVMAPAAARLAVGEAFAELGPTFEQFVQLPELNCDRDGDVVRGEVLYADHFGNLITNISAFDLAAQQFQRPVVEVDGRSVGPLRTHYAETAEGELVAVIGSAGWLEVAVNCGNAAEALGATRGAPVIVREQ